MKTVYMDYAATSPLCGEFKRDLPMLAERFYNPSSSYLKGMELKDEIEETREMLAGILNVKPEHLYFTSGASESNSLAIDRFMENGLGMGCISTNIEHSSIFDNPHVISYLECDSDGIVRAKGKKFGRNLYCIMHVNNEIGTIQPIRELADRIHEAGGYLLCDITQSLGKIPTDLKEMGVDMATGSAHKIGGLKGCGFLYVNHDRIDIPPLVYGTQEGHFRGGTYNYLGIVSLKYALESFSAKENRETVKKAEAIRKAIVGGDVVLNGSSDMRVGNNINVCLKGLGIDSQQFADLLERQGFLVSVGSACHAYESVPSHVLMAMGLSDEDARRSVRITLGSGVEWADVYRFIDVFHATYELNRR